MEQHEFINILKRYRQGDATPEEKKLVDDWYASMGMDVDQKDPDESELAHLFLEKIYPYLRDSRKEKARKWEPWYSVGIAASIAAIVMACIFIIDHKDDGDRVTMNTEAVSAWKDTTNSTQKTQLILLPDGSKVSLDPESTLRFSIDGNAREVYLKGEAFFEVTYNPKLPFLVHANEVTTKVLGTSFIIKAREGEERITVVVKTGRVSVYTNPEKEQATAREIILTPNQQIVFDKKEKEIAKSIVKEPQVIIPEKEIRLMRFEEAPVTEIFKALEKAYGVEIDFDETTLSSCELTTVISEDGIYNRLDIICDAIGTEYTVMADRIVITGAGCKTDPE